MKVEPLKGKVWTEEQMRFEFQACDSAVEDLGNLYFEREDVAGAVAWLKKKVMAGDIDSESGEIVELFIDEAFADVIGSEVDSEPQKSGSVKGLKPIENADLSLVELRDDGNIGKLTPHCKKHGAMNKLTNGGIWRCISTYKVLNQTTDHVKENNCTAGCEYKGGGE